MKSPQGHEPADFKRQRDHYVASSFQAVIGLFGLRVFVANSIQGCTQKHYFLNQTVASATVH